MTPRVRLIVAAALFLGWLTWLSVTALTKSRAPVVSHAQAAVADVAVVADLTAGEGGAPAADATVTESLSAGGPAAGPIEVAELTKAQGFAGPGKYLLLLSKTGSGYRLTDQQPWPGANLGPRVYPWTDATADDLRAQVKKLVP